MAAAKPPTDKMAKLSISKFEGTVKATPNYTGEQDAATLKGAMKGLGTNEAAIINTIGRRTSVERQKLCALYKTMYAKDLRKELDSELGGQLKTIVECLMMPTEEFDAREMGRAMKGLGTNEDLLIEILATRSNAQVRAMVKSYKQHFGMNLEDNIRKETSGDFKNLLISLCNGGRLEDQVPDAAKAKADAQGLYQAGEKKLGTDEDKFNATFASQGFDQLKLVCEEYDKLSKKTMEQAIESEMSGDLKKCLVTLAKFARNRPGYFAEKLYKSMKGLGTDEKTAIRVIVTRCEVDMVQIKQEFQKAYGKSLEQFIKGDFSGDGQKILLALVGGN